MEWRYAYKDGHMINLIYGHCSEKPGGLIINENYTPWNT